MSYLKFSVHIPRKQCLRIHQRKLGQLMHTKTNNNKKNKTKNRSTQHPNVDGTWNGNTVCGVPVGKMKSVHFSGHTHRRTRVSVCQTTVDMPNASGGPPFAEFDNRRFSSNLLNMYMIDHWATQNDDGVRPENDEQKNRVKNGSDDRRQN